MTKQLAAISLALAVPFLASAQCPANPLATLAGSSWAFQYHTPSSGIAAIGTFTATLESGRGILRGTETVNNNGQIALRAPFAGYYVMNSDCNGGELLFNLGGNSIQLDFYLTQGAKSQSEMRFVADSFNGTVPLAVQNARQVLGRVPGISVFVGLATRNPPSVCPPVFADPAQSINSRWLFSTSSFGSPAFAPGVIISADYAIAGIFQTDFLGSNRPGLLTFQETISAEGDRFNVNAPPRNPVRGVTGSGSYTVLPNCPGGDLLFNNNVLPIQYAYVFTENQDTMYMLSLSSNYLLFGDATRK